MKEEKPSKKTFLGIPMNWDRKNILKTMWNPNDDRLLPAKSFGIGWTINFHACLRKIHLIKSSVEKS